MAPVTGPLFTGPAATQGLPWLNILVILAVVPAACILLLGLVRGYLPPAVGLAGVLLPVAAYGLGSLLLLEDSKDVRFCGSCHLMTPIVDDLIAGKEDSLASIHFARGAVSTETACYVCHSGYGIWGTVDAKKAGVMHMVRTITGRYQLPIAHHGPFDIDSCLGCHAHAPRFRAVEAHQPADVQEALVKREMSCTGLCHPAAHPPEVLTGGQGDSG
jgi:hypothetical protein